MKSSLPGYHQIYRYFQVLPSSSVPSSPIQYLEYLSGYKIFNTEKTQTRSALGRPSGIFIHRPYIGECEVPTMYTWQCTSNVWQCMERGSECMCGVGHYNRMLLQLLPLSNAYVHQTLILFTRD